MGWDTWGWNYLHDRNRRWISTPEEFADILRMNRTWLDANQAGSHDPKMLMLSVWNEYGEGHWIMPSEKYSFQYLEAVREVFATTAKGENITPEQAGIKVRQAVTPEEAEKYNIVKYWSLISAE